MPVLPKLLAVPLSILLALAGVHVSQGTRAPAADAPAIISAIGPHGATFTVTSPDAPLRYDWIVDPDGAGRLSATGVQGGAALVVARYRPIWTGPARLRSSRLTKSGNGVLLTQQFDVAGRATTIMLQGHVVGAALVLDLVADAPLLANLETKLQDMPGLQRFPIPYSPVDVYRAIAGARFASLFLDWTASDATQLKSDGAAYLTRTDGTRNPARERLIFSVSPRVIDVLPKPGWPRSRYYDQMAGRLVLDVTTTEQFADIERKLAGLRDVGLSNCVMVVHVWQRLGYDNGLPSVLPPNPFYGGHPGLRRVSDLARTMGCYFALHQNYIDYYPNADTFDRDLIARDARGGLIEAWRNPTMRVQSYSARPRAFTRLATPVAAQIHQSLGTTAAFIDVNPSFPPWQRVDMDARETDGGRFRPFLHGSKALFGLLQEVEQGPLLGEGAAHFYWTGALDGVDADLARGPGKDAPEAPMWVDFDLKRIHPFQQNYGMGYYERYITGRYALTRIEQDIYRTQQLAFAHLPYRSGPDWGDPRALVQEMALAGPVARAYGRQAASTIDYRVADRWAPIENALSTSAGRIVRVRYANNLMVTANTSAEAIADDEGVLLPRGGWSARGAGLAGHSALVAGQRHDLMQSPGAIYADPRETPGNWDQAQAATALTDFGVIQTNGQTWIRCEKGRWTFLGFAGRGVVQVAVRDSVIAKPAWLRAAGGAQAIPGAGLAAGFWRVRLASGQRYASPLACTPG
jgi:hypothetical protein